LQNLSIENLQKAIKNEKGLIFWNREVSYRKDKIGIGKKDGKTHERRFICPDCVYYFFSQLKNENIK